MAIKFTYKYPGRTAAGHLSKHEDRVVEQLTKEKLEHHYETIKIPYFVPESQHYYLTDVAVGPLIANRKPIVLSEIVIGSITFFLEVKGYPFTSHDRKKYILVRDQHPSIDLRFVFSDAHRTISKNAKATCAEWAEKNNFKWAHQTIPAEWIEEARRGLSSV